MTLLWERGVLISDALRCLLKCFMRIKAHHMAETAASDHRCRRCTAEPLMINLEPGLSLFTSSAIDDNRGSAISLLAYQPHA